MSNIHKSISLVNAQGDCLAVSEEEAMGKKLNSWKGWKCAAGVENIFIDADGYLFTATCKESGRRGNIFDNNWMLDDEWVTCSQDWCLCGQDMQLRKIRNPSFKKELGPPPLPNTQNIDRPDWVVPYVYDAFELFPKSVTWDLGRRCNYSCSYCHDLISNRVDPHKSETMLMNGAKLIERRFLHGKKAKWIFTGGEPTVNPHFLNLTKHLRSKGHALHTQTNFSRSSNYYRELIQYSFIGVSVHLEFYHQERLLEGFAAVIEEKENNPAVEENWFGGRIMVGPGRFAEALKLKEKLKELPLFDKHASVLMSPLYDTSDLLISGSMSLDYDPEEYKLILEHA